MARRTHERTEEAKKKTSLSATNFNPGYGQIRNISRGLFPAMRHRFGFMQRCGGRLVFSSLAAVALAAASYARGLKKVCKAVVQKRGVAVKG